jgi:hypothetical protein
MKKKIEVKNDETSQKSLSKKSITKKEVKKDPVKYAGLLNLTYHDMKQMIGVSKELIRDYEDKLKELKSNDSINEVLSDPKKNTEKIKYVNDCIEELKARIKDTEDKLAVMTKASKRLEIFDYIDKCKDISDDSINKLATNMIKKLHEMFGKNGYISEEIKMKDYNIDLCFNSRQVDRVYIYYTSEYSDSPSDYKFFSITLRGSDIDTMCEHMDRSSKEFKLLADGYKRERMSIIKNRNATRYKYFGLSQNFENPEEYEIDSYKIYYDDVCIRNGTFEVNDLDSILWLCKLIGVTL